jgi:peptidoglycan hydrolase-like protein with peptidoglycan-binding domain
MSDEIKPEPEVEVIPAPIPAPKVELEKKPQKPKFAEPIPVDLNAYRESLPQPAGPEVVGTGETDEVRLSAIVFKNLHARRSLSVHHLQRRLAELGYEQAKQDKDGYFGEPTLSAITDFQARNGILAEGLDEITFKRIFEGDPNVTPIV